MSTTTKARQLFCNRTLAAKWVLARRYLKRRGLKPYPKLRVPPRVIESPVHQAGPALLNDHHCHVL